MNFRLKFCLVNYCISVCITKSNACRISDNFTDKILTWLGITLYVTA